MNQPQPSAQAVNVNNIPAGTEMAAGQAASSRTTSPPSASNKSQKEEPVPQATLPVQVGENISENKLTNSGASGVVVTSTSVSSHNSAPNVSSNTPPNIDSSQVGGGDTQTPNSGDSNNSESDKKKFTFNPNAKEFTFNPNAKEFNPCAKSFNSVSTRYCFVKIKIIPTYLHEIEITLFFIAFSKHATKTSKHTGTVIYASTDDASSAIAFIYAHLYAHDYAYDIYTRTTVCSVCSSHSVVYLISIFSWWCHSASWWRSS